MSSLLLKIRQVTVLFAPIEECLYDVDMYEEWGNCPYYHTNPSGDVLDVPEWVFNQPTSGLAGRTYWRTSTETHVFHWLNSQYFRDTGLVILATSFQESNAESESNDCLPSSDLDDNFDVFDDM